MVGSLLHSHIFNNTLCVFCSICNVRILPRSLKETTPKGKEWKRYAWFLSVLQLQHKSKHVLLKIRKIIRKITVKQPGHKIHQLIYSGINEEDITQRWERERRKCIRNCVLICLWYCKFRQSIIDGKRTQRSKAR